MSWKEALTLRGAMERADARSPDDLRRNREAVAVMQQRAAASESLWAGGHAAEGLSMAREAYEAASGATRVVLSSRGAMGSVAGSGEGRAELFVRAGLREALVKAAESAYEAPRPVLDDEVSVADARRLKDHNAASKKEAFSMFILENPIADDENEDDTTENSEPIVIAEKSGSLKTMTPGMAALELGLADTGVVIFNNAKHGRLNVVFKRSDGNIGWIDPKPD